jgi:hypothetical protein
MVDENSKILDDLPHIIELLSNELDPKLADKYCSEDVVILQGKFLNTAIANWSYQQQLIQHFLHILNCFNQINPINIVNYLYADKLKVGVTPRVEVYKED